MKVVRHPAGIVCWRIARADVSAHTVRGVVVCLVEVRPTRPVSSVVLGVTDAVRSVRRRRLPLWLHGSGKPRSGLGAVHPPLAESRAPSAAVKPGSLRGAINRPVTTADDETKAGLQTRAALSGVTTWQVRTRTYGITTRVKPIPHSKRRTLMMFAKEAEASAFAEPLVPKRYHTWLRILTQWKNEKERNSDPDHWVKYFCP